MIDTASSSRDEGSVGGSGAADGAIRPAKSRPRDDRHQVTQATSSPCPCPPSRSRPSEITQIASSSRDEGSVGGGGAVRAPHASPTSRRRDDRHQVTQAASSPCPCPPSRSRPSEITEIASSSRDEGSVGAAALSEHHTPRQSHGGVMIGIRSRRPRRVRVRHLAQDHPRSLRSRARPEMNDE